MILCNGCSKTGTHILTSYAKVLGKKQIGGTLIKRHPKSRLKPTSRMMLKDVLAKDNTHFMHGHVCHRDILAERLREGEHKMLHIVRHPRNVAVSWMRHRNKQDSEIEISSDTLVTMIEGKMFNMSVVEYYSGFLGWLDNPDVLNLRFEDMFSKKERTYKKIRTYLGLKRQKINFDDIYGESSTYTGNWSQWEEWWSEPVARAWNNTGGPELEAKLGYKS